VQKVVQIKTNMNTVPIQIIAPWCTTIYALWWVSFWAP
jgi:hypothetical protein